VRATAYTLTDQTTGEVLYTTGNDLTGSGRGPVGAGILAVVSTPPQVTADSAGTGFEPGHATNAQVKVGYQPSRPIDLRRPGFPHDLVVRFADTIVATGVALPFRPARPAKFRVYAVTDTGETPMEFVFTDQGLDGTLSPSPDPLRPDVIDVLTRPPGAPVSADDITWRIQLDLAAQDTVGPFVPPGAADVWRLRLRVPFEAGDRFEFTTVAETAPAAGAPGAEPYVVPNPYLGAAPFEPAPFNIKGRGERRIEFRNLARGATVRVYTVHGDLVRTLRHDGSLDGFLAWDLRTKDNLDVAPGLYVFRVEAPGQAGFTGKFAVVK
jgi:hypothetical protein